MDHPVVVILSISAANLVYVECVWSRLKSVDAAAHKHSASRVDLEQEDAPVDGRALERRVGESGRRGWRRRVEDAAMRLLKFIQGGPTELNS